MACRPAAISLVEMGSRPGMTSGPTTPPSTTMVRWGACVERARMEARSGVSTPAKTTLQSASSRLADTASSSSAVQVPGLGLRHSRCPPLRWRTESPSAKAAGTPPTRVAEGVGPVHVQDGNVGEQRGHEAELLSREGAVHGPGIAAGEEVRAEHSQRGQERDPHGARPIPESQREVAPLVEPHLPRLDAL